MRRYWVWEGRAELGTGFVLLSCPEYVYVHTYMFTLYLLEIPLLGSLELLTKQTGFLCREDAIVSNKKYKNENHVVQERRMLAAAIMPQSRLP